MFSRIKKESLSQRIISAIRRQILEKGLKPGDRLATEREMAKAFGVSRASVREAIKILKAIGVLESRPKHGISIGEFDPQAFFKYLIFVPYMDKKTIVNMLKLRLSVELGISELVTERVGENELEAMRQQLEAMRRTIEDTIAFHTHNYAFHLEIYKATQNPSIQALGRVLIEFFVTAHREWWDMDKGVRPEHFKNHERIFLALEARNAGMMQQAVWDHFDTSLWQWLRRDIEFDQVEAALKPGDHESGK